MTEAEASIVNAIHLPLHNGGYRGSLLAIARLMLEAAQSPSPGPGWILTKSLDVVHQEVQALHDVLGAVTSAGMAVGYPVDERNIAQDSTWRTPLLPQVVKYGND